MRVGPLLLAITIVSIAAAAEAQTSVGGAVGISSQAAGENDLPYLGRPFGGTALGVIGTIDHAWTRHFSVGGEVSTAGAISGEQSQRAGNATNAFTSRHVDTVFSGTVKFGGSLGSAVRAAAVGGAGAAYRRTAREGTTASIFPPASRAPFSETVSNVVFAYTIGADVAFSITDRLGILVAGRLHQLQDDDRLETGVVARGVSSRIYRAALGVQWKF
jgi:hypothetical protein